MKENKHTPGPWRCYVGKGTLQGKYLDKAIHFTIDSDSRKLMAMGECFNTFSDDPNPFPEIEANAQLIASAPELLGALEQAAKQFDFTVSALSQGHTVSVSSLQNCAALARQAIAKATNRS